MIIRLNQYKKLYRSLGPKKKVLVGGCFDIIHFGHTVFLKKARKAGHYLIVALESDRFIRERKKREPVHNQNQRAAILESFRSVDLVVLLPYMETNENYHDLVRLVKPSVIAVTEGDIQLVNKTTYAKNVGAEIKIVTPFVTDFSSSRIIKR